MSKQIKKKKILKKFLEAKEFKTYYLFQEKTLFLKRKQIYSLKKF